MNLPVSYKRQVVRLVMHLRLCLNMRVVKEYFDKPCKVTVFSWNGKFIIKLESGPFEQTFKVSELDYLEEEIDEILNETFLDEAMERFQQMGMSLKRATNY